jgi:hypothetical protein
MWNKIIVCAQKHWWAGLLVLAAIVMLNKSC